MTTPSQTSIAAVPERWWSVYVAPNPPIAVTRTVIEELGCAEAVLRSVLDSFPLEPCDADCTIDNCLWLQARAYFDKVKA